MPPPRRRVIFTSAFWRDVVTSGAIAFVAFALVGFGPTRTRLRLSELRERGNETTGVVTDIAADGAIHRIRYRFEVDGHTYAGTLRVPLRRYAERYVRGDATPVAYLAADPAVSVPRAKREIDDSFIDWTTSRDLSRALLIAAVLLSVFVWLVARGLRQRTMLARGNLIAGTVVVAARPRYEYEFATPAGEKHARAVSLRHARLGVGDRVEVCWMPRRPSKSRLRQELRYVAIAGE